MDNADRLKVYYIDDDWDDLYLFEEAVASLKIDVSLFRDPAQMIKHLNEADEKPSIFFIDLNMPRVSGFVVIEMIKSDSRYSDIPIIVLSTSANDAIVAKAKAAGADYYIQKPTSLAKLSEAINHVTTDKWRARAATNFLHEF